MVRDTAGPGNNALVKTIELKRIGADEPISIITLDENAGPAKITTRWENPKLLAVSYTGGVLILHVARVGELSITASPPSP